MSIHTAASIKSGLRHHAKRDIPTPGSDVRRLWDLFVTGVEIHPTRLVKKNHWPRIKGCLQDSYGLEFASRVGHPGVSCVGIWMGADLVPLERVPMSDLMGADR